MFASSGITHVCYGFDSSPLTSVAPPFPTAEGTLVLRIRRRKTDKRQNRSGYDFSRPDLETCRPPVGKVTYLGTDPQSPPNIAATTIHFIRFIQFISVFALHSCRVLHHIDLNHPPTTATISGLSNRLRLSQSRNYKFTITLSRRHMPVILYRSRFLPFLDPQHTQQTSI